MTISAAVIEEIGRQILDIGEDKLVKVVALLEEARSHPEALRALERARPRLRIIRPPRRLSLQRLFYEPIEDLLGTSTSTHPPESGLTIDRALMQRCWDMIEPGMDPVLHDKLEAAVRAMPFGGRGQYRELRQHIWVAGASALEKAIAHAAQDSAYRNAAIGDESALKLATQIAGAYRVARDIENVKDQFPEKPVMELDDEDLALIIPVVTKVRDEGIGDPWLLLWVLSARMANPTDLLLRFVKLGEIERPSGPIVEGSVARLAEAVAGIEGTDAPDLSATEFARQAERLAETLTSTQELARGDKSLQPALDKIGGDLRDMVERKVMDGADQDVLAAMPEIDQAHLDDAIRHLPSTGEMVAAEDRVRALRRTTRFAPAINMGNAPKDALAAIRKKVEQRANIILDGLRKGVAPPQAEARPAAEQQLFNTARLVELAAGSSAAEKVLHDGRQKLDAAFRRK